jgi:transposase InsO family protein
VPTTRPWGYQFLVDELSDQGSTASESWVWRLAAIGGLQASLHRRRGKGNKPGPAVHDLLGVVHDNGRVTRDFSTVATGPDQVWLTDITEHWTGDGKLYLCAVKDCWSNKIVGYSIDTRMKSELAAAALRNAIILRGPAGTIVHSDRGSQFRLKKVVRLLKNNDLRGSMGRVASSSDNAAMESFFYLLQKNVLNTRR